MRRIGIRTPHVPTTGAWEFITDFPNLTGKIAFDHSQWIIGASESSLIRIDPVSGDATVISDDSIGTGVSLKEIYGIALEGNHIIVASERTVFRVDPDNGDRVVVAGDSDNSAPPLLVPVQAGLVIEPSGDFIAVAKPYVDDDPWDPINLGALLRIDADTHEQKLLSGEGIGQGAAFHEACPYYTCSCGERGSKSTSTASYGLRHLARLDDGSILAVDSCPGWVQYYGCVPGGLSCLGYSEPAIHTIKKVDPVTGDRELEIDIRGTLPLGPAWSGIAVDNDETVYVREGSQIVQVDIATGTVTTISGGGIGTGPSLSDSGGPLNIDGDGLLITLNDEQPAIIGISPVTGDRKIVSGSATGNGPAFISPTGIALRGDGHLVVTDTGLVSVLTVNPDTGDRLIISGSGVGHGHSLVSPEAVVLEVNGHLIVVDDGDSIRIDPKTGDRGSVERLDRDSDGLREACDNCLMVTNPRQIDADDDNIGNACDVDMDNDCFAEDDDLLILKAAFLANPGSLHWNASSDFNADGWVNFADLAIMKERFLQVPGPSGMPNDCGGP